MPDDCHVDWRCFRDEGSNFEYLLELLYLRILLMKSHLDEVAGLPQRSLVRSSRTTVGTSADNRS